MMRKNTTLILYILTIATFSNFIFAQCVLKTTDFKTPSREKAEKALFAYEHDPVGGTVNQRTVYSIRNGKKVSNKYHADHVFEAQIVTLYLKGLEGIGQELCKSIKLNYLSELKNIINDASNIRFLSSEVNSAKGKVFADKVVSGKKLKAVKDYLAMEDIYNSFSKTRNSMITFLRKVAGKIGVNVKFVENTFSNASRSIYEDLTGRKLYYRRERSEL